MFGFLTNHITSVSHVKGPQVLVYKWSSSLNLKVVIGRRRKRNKSIVKCGQFSCTLCSSYMDGLWIDVMLELRHEMHDALQWKFVHLVMIYKASYRTIVYY